MAIEDAITLAGELGRATSIEAAFAGVRAARRERVEKIVAWGARGSSDKTRAVRRIVRDVMLRVLFRWVITEKSLGWMYDYRIRLARAWRRRSGEISHRGLVRAASRPPKARGVASAAGRPR